MRRALKMVKNFIRKSISIIVASPVMAVLLLRVGRILPTLKIRDLEPYPRLVIFYEKFARTLRYALNQLPQSKRTSLAEKYYVPLVNELFDRNYVNFAQLTLLALEEYFLSKKTEKDFEQALALFSGHAVSAGLRFRKAFPMPETRGGKTFESLAFVGHFVAVSGYEVVLGLCGRLPSFKTKLYAMRAFDVIGEETTCQAFESAGSEFHVPSDYLHYDVFEFRKRIVRDEIDIAVWPLPPFHMFFIFAFGVASKQVWFSQYLRPNLSFSHLDGTLTPGGAGTLTHKQYNGKSWNIIPQVSRIVGINSDPWKGKKFLFTPARLEKLKQPEFLDAVAAILKQSNDTIFKWTGYYHDEEVKSFFESQGLEDRHYYVPWLNHFQLLHEIERSHAILACFPLSLGTVESMAAHLRVPIISLYDEECNLYWRDIFWEAKNGNPHLQKICLDDFGKSKIPVAKTVDEYIKVALRVINEEDLANVFREVYFESYNYTYLNNPNDIDGMVKSYFTKLGQVSGVNS